MENAVDIAKAQCSELYIFTTYYMCNEVCVCIKIHSQCSDSHNVCVQFRIEFVWRDRETYGMERLYLCVKFKANVKV